jgi:serine/threonine-protein kinase
VALSEKAFETLSALVRRGNRLVGKEELLNAVWEDVIVEENNLDKNISLLRQVLGERTGKGKFIETVRGHGFRFVPQVREIVEAENERGRDGAQDARTHQDPTFSTEIRSTKDPRQSRFWLISAAVFSLVVLSLLGLYVWRQNAKSASEAPIRTVAVLPFKPLVAEGRDQTLELGMADALISKLSGGEEIFVRPLSAVRRYDSVEQDSVKAGRELGVEAVLDGSIQISGDRVRVMSRLFRISDGKQLWTGQFDDRFTDIFSVQDSISERVAAALKIGLANNEKKRHTENVEAYRLYMKGRYHTLRLTRAETDKGIAYFQQAIELDPNYALPYVGLARAYVPMALTSDVPSWEVMPKAKAAALRAVEIDVDNAEAHTTLGFISFWYDWDFQVAERQHQRALGLNPNSVEAHCNYAHLLSNTGRYAQALAQIKIATELDPLFSLTGALEGQFLFVAERFDESLDRLNKTIALNPNFWLSHLFLSAVYTEKGMYDEAIAAATKAKALSGGNTEAVALTGYAFARSGETKKAQVVLDELSTQSRTRYVPPYNMALLSNGLGERENALNYLEKGFSEKDVRMVFLKVEPKWNNLRSDSRFVSLLKRMRLE